MLDFIQIGYYGDIEISLSDIFSWEEVYAPGANDKKKNKIPHKFEKKNLL